MKPGSGVEAHHRSGSFRELIELSLPLVLSASFLTLQLVLDRILLTWSGTDEAAASMPAVMLFSTLFGTVNHTIQYSSVFVSQYFGAKRPERIGPVLWHAGLLAVAGGVIFAALAPFSDSIFGWIGHSGDVARHEADYFRILCFAAFPTLVVGVANAYFSGTGRTWTVFAINGLGLLVNAPLAYGWILGAWGFPRLGTTGAGLATLCGSWASMVVALALLWCSRERVVHCLWPVVRWEADLLKRLLKFGVPNGLMHLIDMTAWTAFVFFVGYMSKFESAATNIAFTINLFAFLPLMGLGQGVEILVGRRQGERRPDVSFSTTIRGLWLGVGYSVAISISYVLAPHWFTWPFAAGANPKDWIVLEPVICRLLVFVGIYTVGDAVNIIVSYALRGAGDTKFVALMGLGLAWPLMVIPTWLAVQNGWGVTGAWIFATIYIGLLAVAFAWRFALGHWRTMTVIEHRLVD